MPTCREQILAAVATRLAGIAGVSGLVVERERLEPATALPLIVIYDDGAQPHDDFSGQRDFTLTVTIEGVIAGASDLASRQAADDLEARVLEILFTDVTLGGLASDLRPAAEASPPRLDWEVPAAVGAFVTGIEIDYATKETDLSIFA